jgi:hypothetical protein
MLSKIKRTSKTRKEKHTGVHIHHPSATLQPYSAIVVLNLAFISFFETFKVHLSLRLDPLELLPF